MRYLIVHLVAAVDGTAHLIVEHWRFSRLAVELRVADLAPVTERPVIAAVVIGEVLDEISLFVTTVYRARHTVTDGRRATFDATIRRVADLCAIAKESVATPCSHGRMQQLGRIFATAIDGASHTIIQLRNQTGGTQVVIGTELGPVAEEEVSAVEVILAGRSRGAAVIGAAQFVG